MEENNFEDNIFGEKENFIEDINPDKVKNFLLKLRNNKDLSKILELIKNKITDIIPHIMEIKREYIIFLCHKNFRRKKRNK
jgi:hypothetical protein